MSITDSKSTTIQKSVSAGEVYGWRHWPIYDKTTVNLYRWRHIYDNNKKQHVQIGDYSRCDECHVHLHRIVKKYSKTTQRPTPEKQKI